VSGPDFDSFTLRKYPDPALKTICDPVNMDVLSEVVDAGRTLDILLWKLEQLKGYGLAAPQLGITKRIIVCHPPKSELIELINPEIVRQWGGKFMSDEGCLSYPGRRVRLMRWRQIKVRGLNRWGEPVAFGGKMLRAAVLQHELEHLDGINLADRDEV